MHKRLKLHDYGVVFVEMMFAIWQNHWVAHQVFDEILKRNLAKFSQRGSLRFLRVTSCFVNFDGGTYIFLHTYDLFVWVSLKFKSKHMETPTKYLMCGYAY